MTSGVYQIVCRKTGHCYIGSSVRIERRWGKHREALNKDTHHNGWLQRAWTKYGRDAFVFEVLEICDKNRIEREQHYMDLAGRKLKNAMKTALPTNVTTKSRRSSSKVAIRLIREGKFGAACWTEEIRARVAAASSLTHKGRKHSEQSRARMRQSQKAHWCDPEKKQAHKLACEQHAKRYWTPQRRAEQAERARLQGLKRGGLQCSSTS